MDKYKIALMLPDMRAGGAERFVSNLVKGLQQEFEIHLIVFDKLVEYELPDHQIFKVLDGKSHKTNNFSKILRLPFLAKRLVKYCNQQDISLVISFLSRPNFVSCIAKQMGLKAKIIINERTYTPNYYRKDTLNGKIGGFLVSILYPKADYILSGSKRINDALSKNYGVNNKYNVIKSIVDLENIGLQKRIVVDDVSFNGKFTFITVANLNKGKNHEMLLNAFQAMNCPDCQLLLVGKGSLTDMLKEKAISLGIQDRVIFLGFQANPFKYISRSDCFVFPSDFEGFPNVLIEALACGAPVISTDCETGPRELLAPGTDYMKQNTDRLELAEFGILVPVSNRKILTEAMLDMKNNASMRNKYTKKAVVRAADFESKEVIADFKKVISVVGINS